MGRTLSPAEKREIGQRISTLRRMLDMTQSALATKAMVSQAAISQFESGRVTPRERVQFDLADALHTSRSRLFRELVEAECERGAA